MLHVPMIIEIDKIRFLENRVSGSRPSQEISFEELRNEVVIPVTTNDFVPILIPQNNNTREYVVVVGPSRVVPMMALKSSNAVVGQLLSRVNQRPTL